MLEVRETLKNGRREEAFFSLTFDANMGGGGQRMSDKEGREEGRVKKEQMKNIHVEKR